MSTDQQPSPDPSKPSPPDTPSLMPGSKPPWPKSIDYNEESLAWRPLPFNTKQLNEAVLDVGKEWRRDLQRYNKVENLPENKAPILFPKEIAERLQRINPLPEHPIYTTEEIKAMPVEQYAAVREELLRWASQELVQENARRLSEYNDWGSLAPKAKPVQGQIVFAQDNQPLVYDGSEWIPLDPQTAAQLGIKDDDDSWKNICIWCGGEFPEGLEDHEDQCGA